MDLNAVRADLAAKLTAAGVDNVTVDPRNVQPPCTLIDLPELTTRQTTIAVAVPVRIIAPPPGNLDALIGLLEELAAVYEALRPDTARPDTYRAAGTDCPAYTATVTVYEIAC